MLKAELQVNPRVIKLERRAKTLGGVILKVERMDVLVPVEVQNDLELLEATLENSQCLGTQTLVMISLLKGQVIPWIQKSNGTWKPEQFLLRSKPVRQRERASRDMQILILAIQVPPFHQSTLDHLVHQSLSTINKKEQLDHYHN
jgi:hypothetical protein